jgi:hypothetical protein
MKRTFGECRQECWQRFLCQDSFAEIGDNAAKRMSAHPYIGVPTFFADIPSLAPKLIWRATNPQLLKPWAE